MNRRILTSDVEMLSIRTKPLPASLAIGGSLTFFSGFNDFRDCNDGGTYNWAG